MAKRVLVVFSGVCIIASFYLLKRNYVLKHRLQKGLVTIQRLEESQRLYGSRISMLTNISDIDFSGFGNISISGSGDPVQRLSGIVAGGPKVIFRVTNYDSSIVHQFERIKVLADQIDDSNVVFLLSNFSIKDAAVLRDKFKQKLSVFNVKATDLEKFPPEQYHLPYMFVLDQQLRARFLFLPDKRIPDISDEYFKRVTYFFDEFHLRGF